MRHEDEAGPGTTLTRTAAFPVASGCSLPETVMTYVRASFVANATRCVPWRDDGAFGTTDEAPVPITSHFEREVEPVFRNRNNNG